MDSGEHLGEIDTFQGGRLEIERQPPESEKCCFEKKRNMVKEKIREILQEKDSDENETVTTEDVRGRWATYLEKTCPKCAKQFKNWSSIFHVLSCVVLYMLF